MFGLVHLMGALPMKLTPPGLGLKEPMLPGISRSRKDPTGRDDAWLVGGEAGRAWDAEAAEHALGVIGAPTARWSKPSSTDKEAGTSLACHARTGPS